MTTTRIRIVSSSNLDKSLGDLSRVHTRKDIALLPTGNLTKSGKRLFLKKLESKGMVGMPAGAGQYVAARKGAYSERALSRVAKAFRENKPEQAGQLLNTKTRLADWMKEGRGIGQNTARSESVIGKKPSARKGTGKYFTKKGTKKQYLLPVKKVANKAKAFKKQLASSRKEEGIKTPKRIKAKSKPITKKARTTKNKVTPKKNTVKTSRKKDSISKESEAAMRARQAKYDRENPRNLG